MKKYVILINPPAYQQVESYDSPNYPSITLGYLAGDLLKHRIDCKVIDTKLEKLNISDTINRLREWNFQIVGITAMTHEIEQAACLAEKIKANFKNTTIVIGGVHASTLPQQTMEEFSVFDIIAIGEGEGLLPEIVSAIQKNSPLSKISGIAYKKEENVFTTPPRPRIKNLDDLAFPAWELFPRGKQYLMIASRGCPFHCIFCRQFQGHQLRERSPQNLVEEMKLIVNNFHPEKISFQDESFAFRHEPAIKFLDLIINEGLAGVPKEASMRVNNINSTILKKMKQAGFANISCGIESGNSEMLKRIKKGITLEQAEKAVKLIKQEGLKVGVLFILGLPYETRETAMQTIDFAVKLNADITAFGIMVPYPGTEVARMAAKGEGGYKIISQNWRDYNKQIGNSLELENLSRSELTQLQLLGYIKVLVYNFRFIELAKLTWQYRSAITMIIKKLLK